MTMKYLPLIILALILVGYATASAFGETEVGKAIDEEDFEEVQRLCGQDKELWENAADYVVDTVEDHDSIAEFIEFSVAITGYALLALCRRKYLPFRIEKRVSTPYKDLIKKAANADPILSTEKFLNLLNRVSIKGNPLKFMSLSTDYLFIAKRTDLIHARLDALEKGKRSHDMARTCQIFCAFISAATFQDQDWIESLYDFEIVGHTSYSHALISAGNVDINGSPFNFILAEADKGDLQKLQSLKEYSNCCSDFHAAIEKAMLTAKPAHMRIVLPFNRVQLMRRTFEELPAPDMPKDIVDIIDSYAVYHHYPFLGKRANLAKRIVDKITGANSETEIIGGLVAYYVGLDEENEKDE